jgi:C4-dicarboxylate-specific signal transduction histidine kinase
MRRVRCQVFADAPGQQVLLNLIINAEQAMLTANGRGNSSPQLARRRARVVVLEINDDGPG